MLGDRQEETTPLNRTYSPKTDDGTQISIRNRHSYGFHSSSEFPSHTGSQLLFVGTVETTISTKLYATLVMSSRHRRLNSNLSVIPILLFMTFFTWEQEYPKPGLSSPPIICISSLSTPSRICACRSGDSRSLQWP